VRRLDPPKTGLAALEEVHRLATAGLGLELLRRQLGEDATIEDARRFRAKLRQESRAPCSFLDEELGIVRD